ncbi:MAG: hypothetical protein ACK4TA_18685 [Saprospiraceae bacterium]
MNNFFKRLHTLFNALLASQLVFCAMALTLIRDTAPPMVIVVRNTSDTMMPETISKTGVLALVFLLSAALVAYLFDKQRKMQGTILQDLMEKAEHYRQSSTIRLIMLEAANIFAIVVAMKENNLTYMLYLVLGMLIFLYFRPTPQKFIKQYQLSPAEAEQVRQHF